MKQKLVTGIQTGGPVYDASDATAASVQTVCEARQLVFTALPAPLFRR